jgi:hypothetical protein
VGGREPGREPLDTGTGAGGLAGRKGVVLATEFEQVHACAGRRAEKKPAVLARPSRFPTRRAFTRTFIKVKYVF